MSHDTNNKVSQIRILSSANVENETENFQGPVGLKIHLVHKTLT